MAASEAAVTITTVDVEKSATSPSKVNGKGKAAFEDGRAIPSVFRCILSCCVKT